MSIYVLKHRFTMAEERAKAELERRAELERSYNGLILNSEHYLPLELLLKIFREMDHKSLLSCQLVCRNWLELIRRYTWRQKAEAVLGKRLPANKCWKECLFICNAQPFNKNLIKNHSGESNHVGNSSFEHWTVRNNGGNGWTIEKPPIGAPSLPNDPVFGGLNQCFVTSQGVCTKYQVVDLVKEGFSKATLDLLQPVIRVSEWFCSKHDCPASYSSKTRLLGENDQVMETYNFRKEMRFERTRNVWHKVTKYYKNYGPGLRKIEFLHSGIDRRSHDSYNGPKMAGACIELLVPTEKDKQTSSNDDRHSVEIWYPSLQNSMRPYVTNSRIRYSSLYSERHIRTYSKFWKCNLLSG